MAAPIKPSVNVIQVLVCDASYAVRKDLRQAVEAALPEALVHEAGDGRVALAHMALQRVDLIITDLGLNTSDGQSFLDLLMTNPVLCRKPVLVLAQPPVEALRGRFSGFSHLQVLANTTPRQGIGAAARSLLGEAHPGLVPAP